MKKIKTFKSPRYFKIWAYTASHSTVIIRSEKQYEDLDYSIKYFDSNITLDLEFSGVEFFSIPQNFEGIEIQKNGDKFIFNSNENWFLKAESCIIGKSHWNHDEDVVSDLTLRYNEIELIE